MSTYEAGNHNCKVVGQGFSKTPKTGTEYFGIEVMPEGGSFPRTVKLWCNSESNVERAIARLKDLGWDGSDWNELNPMVGSFTLVGVDLVLVCRHRTDDDGKVWEDFDFPFPPGNSSTGGSGLADDEKLTAKLNRLTGRGKKKKPEVDPALQAVRDVTAAVSVDTRAEDVPF
jgi:hypothetical protein